jgi:Txe/YoeB family toxin of Txe-Axe toxin-antitoxin module
MTNAQVNELIENIKREQAKMEVRLEKLAKVLLGA